ncbi:MAG TPA: hypothetical protein VGJ04_05900, partial [Pirellulales bacterium]
MNGHSLLLIISAIFLAVVLIKLLHLSVFVLFHPHALGVLAVCAVLVFVLFCTFAAQRGGIQAVINTVQAVQRTPVAVTKVAEKNNAKVLAERSTAAVAENNSKRDPNSPPAWINQPAHREGDTYVVVVKLDADTNPAERDEWLDQRMLVAAKDYIDER